MSSSFTTSNRGRTFLTVDATGVDVLPLRACSSLLMAFRERRHRFETGSSLCRRTGQPDTSRWVRAANRLMNRFSMVRLAQPPKGAQALGASVGLFTASGGGVAGPLTTDWSSRLNRPCGNWPDTPENLHGRVLVGHLSVAEVEYPNFSAARRSRRLTCRQDTEQRPFCGAGGGGKTTPDWSQCRSF